jgi:hypothetical protein
MLQMTTTDALIPLKKHQPSEHPSQHGTDDPTPTPAPVEVGIRGECAG